MAMTGPSAKPRFPPYGKDGHPRDRPVSRKKARNLIPFGVERRNAEAAEGNEGKHWNEARGQGKQRIADPGGEYARRQEKALFLFVRKHPEDGLEDRRGKIRNDQDEARHRIVKARCCFRNGRTAGSAPW